MKLLNIITVTKDDFNGVTNTVASTRELREMHGIKQIIVDSSNKLIAEKLENILGSEQNLEYLWMPPEGIASAFNEGIKSSSAKWIWFLNGGDELHPGLNVSLLFLLLANTSAEALIFKIEYKDSLMERGNHPPLWDLWPPLYPNWIPHPGTFLKSDFFKQYGVFDTKYQIAMDGEMWIRLFSKNVTIDTISIPVALYDMSGVSATNPMVRNREARHIFRKNMWIFLRWWLHKGVNIFSSFLGLNGAIFTKLRAFIAKAIRGVKKRIIGSGHISTFSSSSKYWNDRYLCGGNSGAGSYGRLAQFKAEIINEFVADHKIRAVVEYGCGDGAQLELARYPEYIGFDVSPVAIELCSRRFRGRTAYKFYEINQKFDCEGKFDLAISLDVIYHLIEDDVFDAYMKRLFSSSSKYIIVYSSNIDMVWENGSHVRRRAFISWCEKYAKEWILYRHIKNRYPYDPTMPDETSLSDFYIFKKISG